MSNPNPPVAATPRLLWWIGGLALALYAVFLGRHFSNVAGGADSSGYLNSARLLASGQLSAELRSPPEFGPQTTLNRQQFQPHGFAPFDNNPGLSPTYAVGLPLHLAAAAKLCGWTLAPIVVGLGAALGALLLFYATARQLGITPWLAAAGVVVLAAYPVFLFTSVQPLSDTLATTWCLAAVAAALQSRHGARWAMACGAALSLAVLVRTTNALLLPALLVLLGGDFRRWALAFLGGLPGAIWQAVYNHALYGSPLRSGYVDISQAFAWAHAWPTLIHFATWLVLLMPAVVLILPFFSGATTDGRVRLGLALWFGAFVALYACYEISREVWWDLRFILPGTPALLLASLLGLESLARRLSDGRAQRIRIASAVVLIVWSVGLGWFWTQKFHLLLMQTYEQAYADACASAQKHFPARTLVVAGLHSGSLYYYTNFPVLRWEFVNAEQFARFRELTAAAGRPIGALLFEMEEQEALRQKCPGNWRRVASLKNISLWQLEGPAPTPQK